MFRTFVLFIFVSVVIFGCNTADNPTDTLDVPDNVRMLLTSDPDTLASGVDGAFSAVTVTLSGDSGDPLPSGLPVHFSASSGIIQSKALTDESGRAIVKFTPSPKPGVAQINATYEGVHGPIQGGSQVCVVDPRNPVSFLVSADPNGISVRGAGENCTSIISVVVLNGIGEPITSEVEVGFELVDEPMGEFGLFNGNERSEIAETINGIAEVGYNAPSRPYIPLMQISTINLDNNLVTCRTSPVVVVSGPPFQEEIDISTLGIDAGGGAWKIEVSARVWDIHRNPVADGIPVVFTVEPEFATIGTGFTGNRNRNGISMPGVAFTEIVYNSVNTFDHIEISANMQTDHGLIMHSCDAFLPLQGGKLDFNIDPGNWHFDEENEQAVIRCRVFLRDGHGVLINNAQILFTSSKSRFYWKNFANDRFVMFYPEPAIDVTGQVDRGGAEEPGEALIYLLGGEPEFFFDPFTLRTEVEIEVKVLGYESETTKTKTLVVTRAF